MSDICAQFVGVDRVSDFAVKRAAAINAIGPNRFVRTEPHWAALHDPEGHNILLLEASRK